MLERSSIWDIDDILCLLKDIHPVGLRLCLKECRDIWSSSPSVWQSEDATITMICDETAGIIQPGSCSESKYNALNFVADIPITIIEREPVSYGIRRASDQAMAEIVEAMKEAEGQNFHFVFSPSSHPSF